jgi:hypothetical protein
VDAVFVIERCRRRREPAGPVSRWRRITSSHGAANVAAWFDVMGVARAGLDASGLW